MPEPGYAFPDYVSCRLPLSIPHAVHDGYMRRVRATGEVEFTTACGLNVEGAYGATSLRVRTAGDVLEVSGNPAKWLQGHNLFASDNLRAIVAETGERLAGVLQLPVTVEDRRRWHAGAVEVRRVDWTWMVRLPPGVVRSWLSLFNAHTHGGHQRVTPAGAADSPTGYVGRGSRRVSLTLYDKFRELQSHPLPSTLDSKVRARLTEFATDTLRIEARILGMELKDRNQFLLKDWDAGTGYALVAERLGRVKMLDTVTLADDVVEGLPPRLIGVYDAWKAGRDLATIYPRKTFYRYRSELLKHGVDIRVVRPRVVEPETQYALGRPLREFLAAGGAPPPQWAHGTPYLACS